MTTETALPAGPDDGLEGAILELTIGAVAHGGYCVARLPAPPQELPGSERTEPATSAAVASNRGAERPPRAGTGDSDGLVVFVRHALPGERVRARVTEERTSYLRAEAIEILEASPHRVTPPCRFAGPRVDGAPGARSCGGCDLQHADLGYQRELKEAVLREQLLRLGGIDASTMDSLDLTVRPLPAVPGEPDGLGWRTRVQYTVDSAGRAGLLAHRSHEVVPVDRCLIAHADVRNTDALRRAWPEHDTVEVVRSTLLAGRRGSQPAVVSGPDSVVERAVGRTWRLPPTAFWQVHPSAAQTLADTVVQLLAVRPGDRIWDLYGGAGLFAAALAPHAGATGRITVVEADPVAVAAARENLRDLTTVTIVASDVGRALRNPRWRSMGVAGGRSVGGPDIVVLDPPRSGAGREVVAAVADRGPRAVAYVACDPAALARDVRSFRSHGYELAALRAYDLFPHTHHVEAVALLTKG